MFGVHCSLNQSQQSQSLICCCRKCPRSFVCAAWRFLGFRFWNIPTNKIRKGNSKWRWKKEVWIELFDVGYREYVSLCLMQKYNSFGSEKWVPVRWWNARFVNMEVSLLSLVAFYEINSLCFLQRWINLYLQKLTTNQKSDCVCRCCWNAQPCQAKSEQKGCKLRSEFHPELGNECISVAEKQQHFEMEQATVESLSTI